MHEKPCSIPIFSCGLKLQNNRYSLWWEFIDPISFPTDHSKSVSQLQFFSLSLSLSLCVPAGTQRWSAIVSTLSRWNNVDLTLILTPLLVLFLICLYISSRALSKAFEHRNFVARHQRETNHITVAKVASLVTIDASLQYWSKHSYSLRYIINYISKRENDLRILQFFDFFIRRVPLQVIPFKHIRFTPCCHRVFVDIIENKSVG